MAGTPLVQQNVTKDMPGEEAIAKISLEITRKIHDDGFEVILLSGGSAALPKLLLTATWKHLYGDAALPQIYLMSHDSAWTLLGCEASPAQNEIFRKAAQSPRWQGILKIADKEIVSSDIIGEPYAAIVDLKFTKVVDGDLVKILVWYDNEWGYCAMLLKHVLKAC